MPLLKPKPRMLHTAKQQRGCQEGSHLLKILRVSMISLNATKFSMRQLKRILGRASSALGGGTDDPFVSRSSCRLLLGRACRRRETLRNPFQAHQRQPRQDCSPSSTFCSSQQMSVRRTPPGAGCVLETCEPVFFCSSSNTIRTRLSNSGPLIESILSLLCVAQHPQNMTQRAARGLKHQPVIAHSRTVQVRQAS